MQNIGEQNFRVEEKKSIDEKSKSTQTAENPSSGAESESTTVLDKNVKEKRKIKKNLIVFSFSYMLYTASQTKTTTFSSKVDKVGLGLLVFLASTISSIVVSFVLPKLSLKLIGFKWSIAVAEALSIALIVANYLAYVSTLLIASILHGIGDVVLMVVHGTLIATLAKDYATYSKRKPEEIMLKFFAVNAMITKISKILVNIIWLIVFRQNIMNDLKLENEELKAEKCNKTSSFENIGLNVTKKAKIVVCGPMRCPGDNSTNPVNDALDSELLILTIIYLILIILGILIVVVLFENMAATKVSNESICKTVKTTIGLFKSIKIWLLITVFIFMSLMNSFHDTDISKYYVGCAYGIINFGRYDLISSIGALFAANLIAQMSKIINKTLALILSIVTLIAVFIYLHFWTATSVSVYVMFIFAIYFGFVDSIWKTYLHATIGMTFLNREASGFTAFQFVLSQLTLVTFALTALACTFVKIYIILILAVVSFYSVIILEIIVRLETKRLNSRLLKIFNF